MTGAVVVERGTGVRTGNVEFLCLSEHSRRFNLSEITMAPGKHGPPAHAHDDEDDAFYVLEGELVFEVEGEEVVAVPGTFVLIPPGVEHTFENRTDTEVRLLNIHAPAGFDRRLLEG
jgi:mannose-6-phosphate isomerase-like protein (cupin superfamily)